MLQVTRMDWPPMANGFAGHGLAEALGLGLGGVGVATRQHDQELLAAIAADGVVGADGRFHAAGGFAQHGVARQMAVRVVDQLEVVEIRHE